MRWFWGILIAIIGLGFLGRNFGFWGTNQLVDLAQFWPILLIIFGITILVRHLRFGWIIILASFAAALIFIYYASFSTKSSLKQSIFRKPLQTANFSHELPPNINKAIISVETGAIELNLQDGTDKLIEGSLKSQSPNPNLEVSNINNEIRVTLKPQRTFEDWWGKNTLDLKITNQIPVELLINAGASSLNINLTKIRLSKLEMNAGASSINIKIGQVINVINGSINSGASNIVVQLPQDLGAEITTNSVPSEKDFKGFRQINDSTFQNDNYNNASNKINLKIDAGASSIKIKQY